MVTSQKGWAISGCWMTGRKFLYTGWWLTRNDAISEHTRDKGMDWDACRKDGDRAVKITITANSRGPA